MLALITLVAVLQSGAGSVPTNCTELFQELQVVPFSIPTTPIGHNMEDTATRYVFQIPERLAVRFGYDLKRMSENWTKLACGMSVEEVHALVGLGIEGLESKSQTKLAVAQIGRWQTVFAKGRLVAWRLLY
jgi:hypothetical protein